MKMNKQELIRGKEIIDKLVEKNTLKLFRVGCDEKNFKILKELPLTAGEIEKKINLSPMPTNKRLKDMMTIGLIIRNNRGEKIEITDIGKEFIDQIHLIEEDVIIQMSKMV
jgi:predicted transcriptional regulator